MDSGKVGGMDKAGVVGVFFGLLVVLFIVLAVAGVFSPSDSSDSSVSSGSSKSIYTIKLEGEPGKAIQIARMYIKDRDGYPVKLTTDGEDYYDKSQVWGNDRENARPGNIIADYDDNSTCGHDYELHTTDDNRGVYTTMMSDDHPDPRIRMKKGEVNYANFKTAGAVDLEGGTVHVLGRYHCGKKWPQMGEAFKIIVTNVNTGAKATVNVPKLRYDEDGYEIFHDAKLEFV